MPGIEKFLSKKKKKEKKPKLRGMFFASCGILGVSRMTLLHEVWKRCPHA
jgi:hypothetical protein